MKLTSPIFIDQGAIPEAYGSKGGNRNPPLIISDAPKDTMSFAVIMHDPDATKRDYLHWLLWNLPASTTLIAEASLPEGAVEGLNDMKKRGYLRPLPPAGTGVHRYVFELYALNIVLDLSEDIDRPAFEKMLNKHTIMAARLTGRYSR